MLSTYDEFISNVTADLYNSLDTYDFYDLSDEGFNAWMFNTVKDWLNGEYTNIEDVQDELKEHYKEDLINKTEELRCEADNLDDTLESDKDKKKKIEKELEDVNKRLEKLSK